MGSVKLGNPINTNKWLEENKPSFVPPVCNKLMYGKGQLKIMYVGGPNTRSDFHIEEGEEFFYMVKGNMCLKVMEQGKPKDVIIKEGEVFLLPCHIPHSPQRLENTVGLVIEREREEGEQDCLRYYCEDNKTILFEKWFHCADLGKDLVPIVKSFFSSEQHKTGKPIPGTITDNPPFKLDTTTKLADPFSLQKWVEENKEEIKEKGLKVIFESNQTKVRVHGPGEYATDGESETWLWQINGNTNFTCNGADTTFVESDVILIPSGTKYSCVIQPNGLMISVVMDPKMK
ncbi:3-hydroxyanthranilate 3,4-dioxygenase-like [Dendronephthya gigantea]|uniref:3-hydroxyanthranilate 3,4-dioxygenase-like n=1 Tax=Dendronephthya gigantea TaxID=151771 RepID=UPI00106CDA1C|nr:3-hydroxyanthranilate 3,4-dioxygenase-like [Dendronephthya gigantea]